MTEDFHFLRDNFGSEVASLVQQHVGSLLSGGQLDDMKYAQVQIELRPG